MSVWNNIFSGSLKVTAWPAQKLKFRLKIHYEDKAVQSRKIKGGAIIISNHTSVYDYAGFLFVFFRRTLYYQMAEVLFDNRRLLGWFLKSMGGIYVNRDAHDFSFMERSRKLLKKGKIVGIFPEGRLHREGEPEDELLEFKPGAAQLALLSGAPVIPLFTDGNYFGKGRSHVIIGKPVDVRAMYDDGKSEKENIEFITVRLREKVSALGELLNEKKR